MKNIKNMIDLFDCIDLRIFLQDSLQFIISFLGGGNLTFHKLLGIIFRVSSVNLIFPFNNFLLIKRNFLIKYSKLKEILSFLSK